MNISEQENSDDELDLISRKEVWNMLHGLGGCGAAEEFDKGWDSAINEAISQLEDIPGKQ